MFKICRNGLIRIAGTMAAAGLMASAQAALVPAWVYEVETVFNGTNTFEASGGGTKIQNQREVSWGDSVGSVFVANSGRSGITINDAVGNGSQDTTVNPNAGTVVTNDLTTNIGLGAWITHHNNPITAATLLTSQINSKLSLWVPPKSGSADVGPSTLTFTIFFAETDNGATTCADGAANGAGINNNGCSDIFALNQAQAFNQQFTFDSGDSILETYFVSIFPIVGQGLGAFTKLSPQACAAAGAAANCIGFQTREAADTTIRFGFAITAQPVVLETPEPGSLALVGLSLGLFGLLRRRKA